MNRFLFLLSLISALALSLSAQHQESNFLDEELVAFLKIQKEDSQYVKKMTQNLTSYLQKEGIDQQSYISLLQDHAAVVEGKKVSEEQKAIIEKIDSLKSEYEEGRKQNMKDLRMKYNISEDRHLALKEALNKDMDLRKRLIIQQSKI